MNTENLKKLIRALAQADLTIKDAQRLMKTCYEEMPEIEKEMAAELQKPVSERQAVVSSDDKDKQPYTLLGYDTYNQLAFIERQNDRHHCSYHVCDAIEIERFISREYGFAQ